MLNAGGHISTALQIFSKALFAIEIIIGSASGKALVLKGIVTVFSINGIFGKKALALLGSGSRSGGFSLGVHCVLSRNHGYQHSSCRCHIRFALGCASFASVS